MFELKNTHRQTLSKTTVAWKYCSLCKASETFKSPREFCRHLREYHCSKEGGSYVCRYGANNVCPTLPIEGVSDRDYEDHVARDHVSVDFAHKNPIKVMPSSQAAGSGSSESSRASSRDSTPTIHEPSIVTDQHKWTIYNSKVNLPAVLNDPRFVKRETDFFTKTWGLEFEMNHTGPSMYVPEIKREHFSGYLRKVSSRLADHQRIRDNPPQSSSPENFPEILLARRLHNEKSRTELEQVPKLFLLPNFNLENRDTFNAVFPWQQIEAGWQGNHLQPKQSSKLLQEKMSHYLDIVEVQIARQISVRSEAFFHAMTSQDELDENMKTTCEAVKNLREKIKNIDTKFVNNPLKILTYARTRANYIKLYNKLKLMATVHQTQPTIQMLLSSNEFVGAIDLIKTTQDVLNQELPGIHSFRHLGSQLAEMEKLIDKMMQADFVRYSSSDLNRPLNEADQIMEEDRLVSIVFGMLRQHKYTFINIYKEETCTALKAVIKQTVVEEVSVIEDVESENNSGTLADQMRLLNYEQWMSLLKLIFNNVLIILNRAKASCHVICDVISIAAGKTVTEDDECDTESTSRLSHSLSLENDSEVMMSDSDHEKQCSDVREMLCAICDHANDRVVKVLQARSKHGFLEKLGSSEFVSLSREVENFVSDCEAICGRKSTLLRGCLQGQASRFVTQFHEARRQKLSLLLDNERWKQADVPLEFQCIIDHIETTGCLQKPDKRFFTSQKAAEFLIIKEQKYAVVGTVLMLMKIVLEYCRCIEDIPGIAPDLLTRLVDLLKTFNSKSCQLILGAGALKAVGLKKITTKNLVLTSRCLQVIILYIPMMRKHFEDKLLEKQKHLVKHFDQLLKDYMDHISEISNKLVSIMTGIIEECLTEWEVKPPMPSANFRVISKQMCKFHEAIVDLLPREQMQELFSKINECFKFHLRNQLQRLNVTNNGGPQHGLVTTDLAHYTGNLKTLEGLGHLMDNMDDVWL